MPLSDCSSTKPYVNEHPLDYRVNKAAEVAEQSLESEGRAMRLQTEDAAAMFTRQCPDRDLSLMFLS